MKKLGIIGIAIFIIVLGCEYQFASWLQSTINAAIPQGQYYNLIHIATIIGHIFFLGGVYFMIAFYTGLGIGYLASKD